MQLDGYLTALGQLPSYYQQQREGLINRGLALDNDRAAAAQRTAIEQQGIARVRSQQMAADVAGFNDRPTSDGAVRLITTYPELRDQIKDAWGLREAAAQKQQLASFVQMKAAIANGKPDLAVSELQRHVDADKAMGLDTSDDEGMIEMIRSDPNRFLANLDGIIAAVSGPEKFADSTKGLADATKTIGDNERAAQVQPSIVQKAQADASKATTEASFAPQVIQSGLLNDQANRANIDSQIATRAAQVDIARDTLTTNVQLKLQELEDAGARPDAGSVQMMNSAVVSGSANAALAARTRDLADQFSASPARGGAFSDWAEFSKRLFGRQDAVSMLRGQYQQLVNSAAIKALPPGPASDKDIKVAREGFPSPTAPREYIVSWMRGMAKMQDIAAANDNARAEWIAGNGNLGTAKRDLSVNGVQIPKGTTFVDYQRRSAATAGRQQVPPRSYMEFAR